MRISDWSSDVCSSDLFVRLASVLIVGIGIVLIIAPDPIKTGFGLALLLGGGTAFVLAHFRTKVRDELDIDEIVTQPDDVLERNLRALDDFRNLIASGDIPCAERRPDGTVKPLGKKDRKSTRLNSSH